MAGVPFKVCIPSQNLQIGVVASSYRHFLEVVQAKFGFARDSFQLCLDDGTLICDQDYFELLAPQTKITVSEKSAEKPLCHVGGKRPMTSGAMTDLESSVKRWKSGVSSGAQIQHGTYLDSSQVAGLLGLKIASVTGSVPMQPSPSNSPPISSPPPLFHASPPDTSCASHQDAAASHLSNASSQHRSQFFPHVSHASPQLEHAQVNLRQHVMKPPPLHFHGHVPQQLPQWEEARRARPRQVFQLVSPIPQHPQISLQPLSQVVDVFHGYQRTLIPAYPLGGSARMCQYPTMPEPPRLTHHPASSQTSPHHAPYQHQLRQQLASLVQRQLVRPPSVQTHQIHTIPNQSTPLQPALICHRGAQAATHDPSPNSNQLSAHSAVRIQQPLPSERLQTPPSSLPGMRPLVSNHPQHRRESLTYVSVIDIEKEPQNGEEPEYDDGGLGLSIVEDETQSSNPITHSTRPAFFPPPKLESSPQPSSLTLQRPILPNGYSAADATVAEETPAEEGDHSPKGLEENSQHKDSSPDDGYCSSSPPGSATEKLPFADFDFFHPPTQVQAKSLMERSQCATESKEATSPSLDGRSSRETYIDEAETELFTFRQARTPISPAKPKLPPKLKVTIPVVHQDGQLVCKGYSTELNVSIAVSITASGRIVCQGVQSTEEEEEPPESPPFTLALEPDTPIASPESDEDEEEVEVEVVTVQDYVSEELVYTATHICSEAILKECVEEILALAKRTRGGQCVNAEDYLPLVPEKGGVVLMEGDGGDFVNEVTVSDSEEDDDEVNTADLIKREMELKLSCEEDSKLELTCAFNPETPCPELDARPIKQSKISESVEKILCLAEQLSTEESKIIRDFFYGESCVDISSGTQCFVLKKMDDKQVNLEIDFLTGEWRGYISPQI